MAVTNRVIPRSDYIFFLFPTVEGLRYSGDQTKGACLVPKRAMNVMEAEVNRVLQLGDSSIVPINWKVPRKVNKLPLN